MFLNLESFNVPYEDDNFCIGRGIVFLDGNKLRQKYNK